MPLLADVAQQRAALSRYSVMLIVAMIAAGFGLTLFVFYPGVMTYDAKYVYGYIAQGFLGDWQSPVMTVLWGLIDPIAPGPGSMFLLTVMSYWLAFGLLAFTMVRRSVRGAIVLLLLAVSPPAFVFIGIIWRDVLFATTWLLAAALVFAVVDRNSKMRVPIQAGSIGLLALGVLLRPNALIAAPILCGFIFWPAHFSWKRTAIIFVPVIVAMFALVQVVYYGALGAKREHPLHSVMVFDLGGISHFAKQNQFPGSWTLAETEMITTGCYQPTLWDIYWTREPCRFVMSQLERDKIFGTPVLVDAWKRTVMNHPVAYFQHRAAFMWNFMSGSNLTLWTLDVYDTTKMVYADRTGFTALKAVDDALKPTPLFRTGSWLLACIAVCALAWRRRHTPAAAFAIGVCGSAAVYVLTFFAVGVASDFRYVYWAVLASITGAVAVALSTSERN